MNVGYARTSTVEQLAGIEAQVRTLKADGCDKIFEEHCSVAKTRTVLAQAVNFCREGDTFIVTALDRLCRSVPELSRLTKELQDKGVNLKIINLGFDMSTPTGLMMINMLAIVAEFERNIMMERQKEGIAKAKAEGKFKGRKALAPEIVEAVKAYAKTGANRIWIAKKLYIGEASVYRILKAEKEAAPK